MSLALLISVLLIIATGVAHSYLGERYILMRLFRRGDLPPLFGGPEFTRMTLRFAWHITTVAWFGLAAILLLIAYDQASIVNLLWVLAATSFASALVAALGSRLRHLSWLVFLLIAALLSWSALQL